MNIDISTLAIALGIIYAIQFVIFLHEYHYHKDFNGPGWWLLWSSAAVAGFICMQTRQIKSIEYLSILLQNIMHILAMFFLYTGIMRFKMGKERAGLLKIIFLLHFIPYLYFLFIDDNINNRTIIIWTTIGLISLLVAFDLNHYRKKTGDFATTLCILSFLFHAFFSITKVILLLTIFRIDHAFSPKLINSSSYIEILIVSIIWTYALIIMINERLTSEMKNARDHFEIIYNTSPDAIVITHLNTGAISSVNKGFFDISGYSPEESLGKTTLEINLWKNIADRQKFVSLMQKEGYCINYEADFRRKDQRTLPSLISSKLIEINGTMQMISIIRDITELKEREREILNQNSQLKLTNLEKDKFFSIIAHDLRGPFSSFLGLTEIMAEEIPHMPIKEVIKLAARMRDSARNIFSLLNNLLEWSMIKQGISKFNPAELNLLEELRESMSTFQELGKLKNITLLNLLTPEVKVYADKQMLLSLIRNLLTNAIKFTPEDGNVTIAARSLADQGCLISIKDSGIGISSEMQKMLFRIDANISRKGTKGELSSGLGLLLCKEYVNSHNGEIWVESKEGEGSIFYVKLPGASAQSALSS